MSIAPSELILNDDGSIYHLHLRPEHIADTIITVGDPDRVSTVTSFFDTVEFETQKREFHTQTGTYKGKRLTVISTGIGTDNIDIVVNELDALVNIDFKTRTIKKKLTSLNIIRIGTSGAIREDIPIDSFVVTETAIGLDSLLHHYQQPSKKEHHLKSTFENHMKFSLSQPSPYIVDADPTLLEILGNDRNVHKGITVTNVGFYAPQGRILRAAAADKDFIKKLGTFKASGKKITNLEMETSGIYGMAQLLGHKAVSMNAILANRITGEFSAAPKKITKALIAYSLEKIVLLS